MFWPKDLPSAIRRLQDRELDLLLAAVLAEQELAGNAIDVAEMSFFVTEGPAKRVQRDSGATKPRSLQLNHELICAAAPKNFEHEFATVPTWAPIGQGRNDTWGLAGRQGRTRWTRSETTARY
jgi:hypothetical protein